MDGTGLRDAPTDEAASIEGSLRSPTRRASIWLDGRLVPADARHLSVTDRGFQLGDGIFESLRARRGIVIDVEEHLARLHESAAALALPLPLEEVLVDGMLELIAAEGLDDAALDEAALDEAALVERGPNVSTDRPPNISTDRPASRPGDAALRITVSRGEIGRRGLLPPGWDAVPPTVAIQAWPYVPPAASLLERGVAAILTAVRRDSASPLAGVKSTSRAELVFAKLEAERSGADDAIFTTMSGHLAEATTANLFLLSGDTLSTPPLSAGILAGTTRTWLVREARTGRVVAGGRALEILERDLVPADLAAADEAFLSSSVAGIVPLTRFEGEPIGAGRPGAVTLELRAARDAAIDALALAGAIARRRRAHGVTPVASKR